jgi:hypothetical protein
VVVVEEEAGRVVVVGEAAWVPQAVHAKHRAVTTPAAHLFRPLLAMPWTIPAGPESGYEIHLARAVVQ